MHAERQTMELIAHSVVDASIRVHRELGAGLLESVYQTCFALELRARGHQVECEVPLPIKYGGTVIQTGSGSTCW
jgi:GxxExxY protein